MKKVTRLFFFASGVVVLLASATLSAPAQQSNSNSPRPTPTPTPSIPVVIRGLPGSILSTPSDSSIRLSNLPGINGSIRWRTELGLPYDATSVRPPYPVCNMFRVRLTMQEAGAPGTFGRTITLFDFNASGNPTGDSGYYVCSYSIPDKGLLPRGRVLLVMAELDTRVLKGEESQPWPVGTQPQPPPGYERTVIGSRGVTLTDTDPHATVDFEMVYQPIPTGPR